MCETFLPANLVINSQVVPLHFTMVQARLSQVNWNKNISLLVPSWLEVVETLGRTVTASIQLLLSSAASLMSWTCLKLIEILNNISENGR